MPQCSEFVRILHGLNRYPTYKWYNSVLDGHLDFFTATRHPVEHGLSVDVLADRSALELSFFFAHLSVLARAWNRTRDNMYDM